MKKLLPVILLIALAGTVPAQKPEAYIYKLSPEDEIVIDGVIDPVWNSVEEYQIDKIFQDDSPTIDIAYWKGIWTDTAIFILIDVEENEWYPYWFSIGDWDSDKAETYFDMNTILDDGGSPSTGNGHYQVCVPFMAGGDPGGIQYDDNSIDGHIFSSDTYDSVLDIYTFEYSVGFINLLDNTETSFNPLLQSEIGFDAVIVDTDEEFTGAGQRTVWSNTGETDENWNNMDDAGLLHFVDEVIVSAPEQPETEINSLEIFPNPAKERINFNKSVDQVRIYNTAGVLILNSDEETAAINISQLKDGIYVVRAVDGSGNDIGQRFIKQ